MESVKELKKNQVSVEEKEPYDSKEPVLSAEEFVANYPDEQRRKAVRKVDYRLLTILLLLYLMSYLDRANVLGYSERANAEMKRTGNAKIEGLEKDLNMSDIATAVFFIPYCLFEVPSNYVLKRYFSSRPSLWIAFLVLSWGLIMTLTGIVQNFAGLCVARVMLGLAEAGFFPAAILLTSYWYLKDELQLRISIFYLASSLSGAFSGLLAFAIAKMHGVGGLEGWRWIFILEGIATVLMGVITLVCLPDSPERSSKWLDEDEIRYLKERMIVQDGGSKVSEHHSFNWGIMKQVVLDWKLYMAIILLWAVSGPTFGLKFTMPEIITTMGYESSEAQLLSMPPYILGGISGVIIAIWSDKYTWRMPFIVGPLILEVTGFAILFGLAEKIESNVPACYFAVCLANIGIYPLNPGISTWTSNNQAGPQKRALAIGYYLTFGNAGGIIGSFIYKNSESPKYETGYGTSLGLPIGAIFVALIMEYILMKQNQWKNSKTEEEWRQIYSDEQLAQLGDASPLYKMTL